MSQRNGQPETVADRVKSVIESTPPREGRRSRLGHISIEDFADLLGTTKARVIEWRKGTAFPDQTNRDRLAGASGGRYSADDFKGPSAEENRDLLAVLREEVAALTRALDVSRGEHRKLAQRVGDLEKTARTPVEAPLRARAKRQGQTGP